MNPNGLRLMPTKTERLSLRMDFIAQVDRAILRNDEAEKRRLLSLCDEWNMKYEKRKLLEAM